MRGQACSMPAFHALSCTGLPLGCLCLFFFSLICRPLPPLGFLGWKKGPGGEREEWWRETGAWSPVQGPTQRLSAGAQPTGFEEAERPPRVPTLPVGVLNWKKGSFAGPVTPDPQPGQRSQPHCPCQFQPARVLPRPCPPSNAALFAPPIASTPGWSCHMAPCCCPAGFLVLEFILPGHEVGMASGQGKG